MPKVTLTPHNWTFTRHAELRAHQRGITHQQILDILADPELTYAQRGYPGRHIRQRGGFAIVIQGCYVITVLHHLGDARTAA